MGLKDNLLKAFSEGINYYYHLEKNKLGHLIYVSIERDEYSVENLEFKMNVIIEGFLNKYETTFQKVAPSIYFTDETNTEKLNYELGEDFKTNSIFSEFILSIKEEYRILEVKDFLLYKEDPEAYEKAKEEEYQANQQRLLDELKKQQKSHEEKRKKIIREYNNNLITLFKDALIDAVLYEKQDFELPKELSKLVFSLIENDEKWAKRENQFVMGNEKFEPIDIFDDTLVLLVKDPMSDTFKITLKLVGSELVIETVETIIKNQLSEHSFEEFTKTMKHYDFLMKIFDIENNFEGWDSIYDNERLQKVIEVIIKTDEEKEAKKKEMKKQVVDSSKAEAFFIINKIEIEFGMVPGKISDIIEDSIFEPVENFLDEVNIDFKRSEMQFNSIEFIEPISYKDVQKIYDFLISHNYMLDSYRQELEFDFMDLRLPDRERFDLENKIDEEPEVEFEESGEDGDDDDTFTVNNKLTPKDYFFSVFVPQGNSGQPGSIYDDFGEPSSIALVEIEYYNQNHCLDDSFGSHALPKNVINALNNAGIYGETELMEAIWEVIDNNRTEEDIIQSMEKQGFIYNPNIA